MAKSARASSRKSARVNTRAKVFLPAYDARTARLSEKLQQIATEKKPTDVNVMEVDTGMLQLLRIKKESPLTASPDATKEGEQAEGRSLCTVSPPLSPSLVSRPVIPIPSYFLDRDASQSESEEEEDFYMALGLVTPWAFFGSGAHMEIDGSEEETEEES